ncbi:MAG: ABC transporter substrate-binding protein [Pseudomonadota bacterium]
MGFWRYICLISTFVLVGCADQHPIEKKRVATARAQRIVSLDYCADQFVLKLVDKTRILALSPDAEREFSYMRGAAHGIAKVRPVAEDVLALQPDLIVRVYGGGANAAGFFRRAGVPVVNIRWTNTIDQVKTAVIDASEQLGATERGASVVAEMEARLAALTASNKRPSVLYMTPAGVSTGPGSLVHDILTHAGLENFQSERGWRPIPLERLALESPDIVAASFFGAKTNHRSGWSAMRHPVAKGALDASSTVYLDGSWTSCGGWYVLDAVEALAKGAQQF